jgi:putative ABC transport system ATP-binding protein
LRCINFISPPTSGTVTFDGVVYAPPKEHRLVPVLGLAEQRRLTRLRAEIGMVFQLFNVFPHLTAAENVALGLRKTRGLSRAAAGERARRQLGEVGLGDTCDAYPERLSGGQKQRVAIARALVNRPSMVLADEPTASLDAESSQIVLDLLRGLADGPTRTTVLLVTHDQRVIDKADRIVNMVGGRIVTNSLTKVAVRICRALAATESLSGLGEATLSRIANRMTVEFREPGETIVRQGDDGDRFYVIGTGVADAYIDGEFNEEKCYGEAFGMITSYFKRPIAATVVARTEMELYVLSKDDFLGALVDDQTFEARIRSLLAATASAPVDG